MIPSGPPDPGAGWRGPVLAVAIAAVVFGTAIAYGLAGRAGRPG